MKKKRNWVGHILMAIFKLFPIKKNRIYFSSRYGQHYACNPKAYFEYLYKNHHDEFEFYYCLNKNENVLPKDVKTAKFMSLKDMYYLHTSKYVVTNVRMPMIYAKRKKQIYIQTWHGGPISYKMIEKDQTNITKANLWNAKVDGAQIDMLLVGSIQSQKVMDNCFFCDNKTVLTGNPRCDILVNKNPEEVDKILNKIGLSKNDYIVLYAPTFRDQQDIKQSIINNELLKQNFEKITDKNVKILYRFHPKLAKQGKDLQFEDYVVNVTSYSDMQDLVLISDIMITDFSSCMFDMVVADKPCIIYTNNGDQYLTQERGVYFPSKELPFPVANTEDELQDIIKNLKQDIDKYLQEEREFMAKNGSVEDGHACERLYKEMMKR